MLCRCVSSSSTTSSRFTALSMKLADARERLVERLLRDRLLEVGERARLETLLPLADARDDVHRNVPRLRMMLEPVEHRPAVHARHVDVERDGVRLERVRELEPGLAVERDESLESLLARHLEQNLREVRVVLDDEQDGERGLELAHAFKPDAITLDIDMPGIDGWEVLDRLKHHPDTRHIPVHIITGIRERQQGLKAGAMAYLEKPVTKEALEESFDKIAQFIDQQVKRLLVVEDDETQRQSMVELIAHEDVEITAVAIGRRGARRAATRTHFDCMVLDLGLRRRH